MLNLCLQLVKDSWDIIDPKFVVNSFKEGSVKNEMDGTVDDMSWKEDDDIPPSSVEHQILSEEDLNIELLDGEN